MDSRSFEYDEPAGTCADCGQGLSPELDRCCRLAEPIELCEKCAVRRGGVFDADAGRWSALPDVGDLLERRHGFV